MIPDVLLDKIPLLAEGGPVMGVLYGISLLGFALILERTFALRRDRIVPSAWMREVQSVVAESGLNSLGKGSVWPDVSAADALREFVQYRMDNLGETWEKINILVDQQLRDLQRGLVLIGLLAALAPLLGLLGTVSGMIETFRMIAEGGIGDPKALAGGIYQALYTTAAGLTLAIPLTIAHRLLRGKAEAFGDQIAEFLERLWWLDRGVDPTDES